jgi:hypothetical protein
MEMFLFVPASHHRPSCLPFYLLHSSAALLSNAWSLVSNVSKKSTCANHSRKQEWKNIKKTNKTYTEDNKHRSTTKKSYPLHVCYSIYYGYMGPIIYKLNKNLINCKQQFTSFIIRHPGSGNMT